MGHVLKTKVDKTCVCGKTKHKSKGSADAQIRGLKKLQTLENGKKDIKKTSKLHAYRSRACERQLGNKQEIWHVGHR